MGISSIISILILSVIVTVSGNAAVKRDTAATVPANFEDFRENCFPRGGGEGCRCTIKAKDGGLDQVVTYNSNAQCKTKDVAAETAKNKMKLNEEINHKFGLFRENCFPRATGRGCRCNVKDGEGNEKVETYERDEECKRSVEEKTMENKKALHEEFEKKYGGLKENCFPRPKKGCRCSEKNAQGEEITKLYEKDADCKLELTNSTSAARPRRQASQNVRDPVRERAQANYAAVINELKDKFRGLKEGCFPRPKGCLCVIGKDSDGRDLTQRRMKDADCKCHPNERSRECPAPAA